MTQRRSIVKKIGGISRPDRTPLAHGVVVMDGEVVLAKDAVTETDSTLFLRLAAAAAQSGLPISDSTIAHFKSHFTSHQIEWNAENRDSLISLLGSGNALTPVWAALDEAGLFDKLFVHWRHIRATPQRNALHVFTVDRHSIETAVNAAKFTRNVRRPDLLLIAALFHDIGKGMPGDHSEVGVPLIEENAAALGYSSTDIGVLKKLVRHHLLLAEYATRRDLDDVATITEVADKVQSQEVLELLHYLTIADSQSAAPSVWNEWKNRLLAELVAKTSAVLAGEEIPESASIIGEFPTGISDALVLIESSGTNVQLKVATEDHVGLLSAIAGVLSLERLQVRSANFDTHNNTAYQVWNLVTQFGDAPDVKWLSQQIRHAAENFDWVQNRISGLLPLQSRNRGLIHPGPQARFLTATSQRASILEVRAHDEPALLYRATSPIAHLGFSVVNAHVETLGSEVIDVLYLQTQAGETLTEAQCQQVVTAVLSALSASEAE
jgi:[protein-PII] uridylyltransferase